jgi:HlyD family secretion protein
LLQFHDFGDKLRIATQPIMAQDSKRKWIVLVLAGGLALLVLVLLRGRSQGPIVSAVKVTREDLSATITSNGKVEPVSPAIARAAFPAFVDKVMAIEGQAVRRGQVVLTLDAADVRSQLAQVQASLLEAKTELQNARAGGPPDEVAQLQGDLRQAKVAVENLERTEQALEGLVAKQAATQDELAQNKAALSKALANLQTLEQKEKALAQRAAEDSERADLRVQQTTAQVHSLEEKVRSASVNAPTDGTLYSLPVRAGDYVKVGDVLAEMADLRNVRVRAFVDEPDLGWLEPNQEVQVIWDAKPGRTWIGRTEQVPKQVVPLGARSVGEVLCSMSNDKVELLPNINVEVRILVRGRHDAIVVPRAAVRYDKGQHYVFLLAGDKVRRQGVSVGVASPEKYEVLTGLVPGERVALPGDTELRDGMDVRVTEAD